MKNVFLGLALATMSLACVSEQKASVDDASTPGMEACETGCTKPCCAKEDCTAEKAAECSAKKVCPVTGQEMN